MRLLPVLLACISFLPANLYAQWKSDSTHMLSLGLRSHYGFIIAHSTDVQNTDGANPYGFELDISLQSLSKKSWDLCRCYPKSGLFIGYFNYDRPSLLGYGLHAAGYVEPFFSYKGRLSPSLKAGFGLTYNSEPYDAGDNPSNQSYSLPVNFFVMLNLGLSYRLQEHFVLHGAFNYNHVSNGGVSEPNKGINFPTVSVGTSYIFNPQPFPDRLKRSFKDYSVVRKKWSLSASGTGKSLGTETQRFPVLGLMLKRSHQVGRLSALLAAFEWVYDGAKAERFRRNDVSASAHQPGLMVGHEFLMGKFVFSQALGLHLYYKDRNVDLLYQRWGLDFYLGKSLFVGGYLQSHRHVANFIDVRLGYTF